MKTRITELFGIDYPIVQGGLAHLAYADLAAAVSNAGGLGQITALTLPNPNKLREEIHKVRTLTNKPFGVNFAIGMGRRPYKEYLQVAIDENVPVITMAGGNPAPLIEELSTTSIKKVIIVSSVRQAQKAEKLGADAVVCVGHEGGGHIGVNDVTTMVLTPRVVDSVSIPVIAAGGIGDARGLVAAISLGADGIEMGTRFIATHECLGHHNYKNALVQNNEESTVVIKRTLRQPGRALKSKATETILDIESKGGTYEDLKQYISGANQLKGIYEGDVENYYSWAGQVIGLIDRVTSCEELIKGIIDDTHKINKRLNNIITSRDFVR